MKRCLLIIAIGLTAVVKLSAQISSTEDVIKSMRDQYYGKWYEHVTFIQETSFYQEDTLQRTETWFEAMKMPEGLIIKFDSIASGSGLVFKNDSMWVYKNNELVGSSRRVHDLLVLGFSVYFDPITKTIQKLEEAGFDISSFKEEEAYYVIGNSSTKRAWISKDKLLFERVEKTNQDGSISAIEFNNYIKLGKAWIAPEVIFYRDGEMTMKEVYHTISAPKKLPDLFNTKNFKDISWSSTKMPTNN